MARAFVDYQRMKEIENVMNFDDQIFYATRLLRECPRMVASAFPIRYLMVDEYQDMNSALLAFLEAFLQALKHTNIICVGDANQSIFSFRASSPRHFDDFTRQYPAAPIWTSQVSFRSSQDILNAAHRLITKNKRSAHILPMMAYNHQQSLSSPLPATTSSAIQHLTADTHVQELQLIAQSIHTIIQNTNLFKQDRTLSYRDIAVLVRHNADAVDVHQALAAHNIPSKTTGMNRLFERPEIRTMMAFLASLVHVTADTHNLYYLMGSNLVYNFTAAHVSHLMDYATTHGLSLRATLSVFADAPPVAANPVVTAATSSASTVDVSDETNHAALRTQCRRLVHDLQTFTAMLPQTGTRVILMQWLRATGWAQRLHAEHAVEDTQQGRNISKFLTLLEEWERNLANDKVVFVERYLADMSRFADDVAAVDYDDDIDTDEVQIMSIHRSKGLEFDTVYLYGCVDHKLPGTNRQPALRVPEDLGKLSSTSTRNEHVDEERRLVYVALTRARSRFFFTSAADYGQRRKTKPSRFIAETLGSPAPSTSATAGAVASESTTLEIQAPTTKAERPARKYTPKAKVLSAVASVADAATAATPTPTSSPTPLQHAFAAMRKRGGKLPAWLTLTQASPVTVTQVPARLMGCVVRSGPSEASPAPATSTAMIPTSLPTFGKFLSRATVESDGMINLSYSRLSDYMACPLRYHFNYNLRLPTPPNHHLQLGGALHTAIEAYAEAKMQGKEVTDVMLHHEFTNVWKSDGCKDKTHAKEVYDQALFALTNFHKLESASTMMPSLIEQRFQINVRGQIRFTGVWDRIDLHETIPGTGVIKEYKKALSDFQVKGVRTNLQLQIYAWAFEIMFGFLPAQVILQEIGTTNMGVYVPSSKDLDRIPDMLLQYAQRIKRSDYQPTASPRTCSMCPFKATCPHKAAPQTLK
jgi:superfamily I DNA/RNA helicase/CRISPR/Cas system-associated exonuclease Cas4 (RecB family)